MDALRDQTGLHTYAVTTGQTFTLTRQGENTFVLIERGTFDGGYALSCVAYAELGTTAHQLDARGTWSQAGTVSSLANQSFGDSLNYHQALQSSQSTYGSIAGRTYGETREDSFTLSEQGAFGAGSFSFGNVNYSGTGEGQFLFSETGLETITGSFSANATTNGQDRFGFFGTTTAADRAQNMGSFTSTRAFDREETGSGEYHFASSGSYVNGVYRFSNLSVSQSASSTFALAEGSTYTEAQSRGTLTSSGSAGDDFDLGHGTVSTDRGQESATAAFTVLYTRSVLATTDLNREGSASYSLLQSGSAANGSYHLDCYVYQSDTEGAYDREETYSSEESGTVDERESGNGLGTLANLLDRDNFGEASNGCFNSAGSSVFARSLVWTEEDNGAYDEGFYRAGNYANASFSLSSVAHTLEVSRAWSRSGSEEESSEGTLTSSDVAVRQASRTAGFGNATFAGVGQGTATNFLGGTWDRTSSSSFTAGGSESSTLREEGVFAGFSHAYSNIVADSQTNESITLVRTDEYNYRFNGTDFLVGAQNANGSSTYIGGGEQGTGTVAQTSQVTFSVAGSERSTETLASHLSSTLHHEGSFANGSYSLSSFVEDTVGGTTWSSERVSSAQESGPYSWTNQTQNVVSSSFLEGMLTSDAYSNESRTSTGQGTYTASTAETLALLQAVGFTLHQEGTYGNQSFSMSSVVYLTTQTQSGTVQLVASRSSTGTIASNFAFSGRQHRSRTWGIEASSGQESVSGSGVETVQHTDNSLETSNNYYIHSLTNQQWGTFGNGSFHLANVSFIEITDHTWDSNRSQEGTSTTIYRTNSLATPTTAGSLSFSGSASGNSMTATVTTTATGTVIIAFRDAQEIEGMSLDTYSGRGSVVNGNYHLSSVVFQSFEALDVTTNSEATITAIDSLTEQYTRASTFGGNNNFGGTAGTSQGTTTSSGQRVDYILREKSSLGTETSSDRNELYEDGVFSQGSFSLTSVSVSRYHEDTSTGTIVEAATHSGTDSWTESGSFSSSGSNVFGLTTTNTFGSQSWTQSARETFSETARETFSASSAGSSHLTELGSFGNFSYSFGSVVYRENSDQHSEDRLTSLSTWQTQGSINSVAVNSMSSQQNGASIGSAVNSTTQTSQASFSDFRIESDNFIDQVDGTTSLYLGGTFFNGSYAFSSFAFSDVSTDSFTSQNVESSTLTRNGSRSVAVLNASNDSTSANGVVNRSGLTMSNSISESFTEFARSTETLAKKGTGTDIAPSKLGEGGRM